MGKITLTGWPLSRNTDRRKCVEINKNSARGTISDIIMLEEQHYKWKNPLVLAEYTRKNREYRIIHAKTVNVGINECKPVSGNTHSTAGKSEHQSFIERDGSWKNRDTNLSEASKGSHDLSLREGSHNLCFNKKWWACRKTPSYTIHSVTSEPLICSLTKTKWEIWKRKKK